MHIVQDSIVKFEGNSIVTFYNNKVFNSNGGAVYVEHNSAAEFDEYSTVKFYNNSTNLGASVFTKSS